uniref:histidine kinase n=1 Tax=Paramoeba aestuarina TaxID=180227 RepID=A0A7S4UHC9_9EUKA|mmetsp:Transcript_34043/g.53258  ORF Transcript_34043/g.53258 Transcript_34043/m.53258 type:complete len:316 (+) Transcript_34043:68-1015(+)
MAGSPVLLAYQIIPLVTLACVGVKLSSYSFVACGMGLLGTFYLGKRESAIPEEYQQLFSNLCNLCLLAELYCLNLFIDVHIKGRMREKQQQLVKALHAKFRFICNVTHELRTPLHGLLSACGLLMHNNNTIIIKNSNDISSNLELLKTIDCCGQLLLSLVNNLLDTGKIESGDSLCCVQTEFSINDILETSLLVAQRLASAKNLHMIVDIEKCLPKKVIGDGARISQVLINIFSNAIKYSPPHSDGVIFRVTTTSSCSPSLPLPASSSPSPSSLLWIVMEVIDNGIGIPPSMRNNFLSSGFKSSQMGYAVGVVWD